jgi:hypothetical protein
VQRRRPRPRLRRWGLRFRDRLPQQLREGERGGAAQARPCQHQVQWRAPGATARQPQRLQATDGEVGRDHVPRQPRKAHAGADQIKRGLQLAHGPALIGAQPADVAPGALPRIADHDLSFAAQRIGVEHVQRRQRMAGSCHRDELDLDQHVTQKSRRHKSRDHQIGLPFEQGVLGTRQHHLAQLQAGAVATAGKAMQRDRQQRGWKCGVDHQPHFRLPSARQMPSQRFQLGRIGHQAARMREQALACFGQTGTTPLDAECLDAELPLQLGHRRADRRLAAMKGLGRLREAAPLDHRDEHPPLIEGNLHLDISF